MQKTAAGFRGFPVSGWQTKSKGGARNGAEEGGQESARQEGRQEEVVEAVRV